VKFPDYGTELWHLAVEMFAGKQESTAISAPILPSVRELSLAHAQICSFLFMEQICGLLAIELFQERTAISARILPRVRKLSLENAQKCSFLIMEQSSGPWQ
jgi:hypothetical protein